VATQAVGHLTRIEFNLDEYLHRVRMVLGCGITRALQETERLLATGQLLLICREYDADGNQIGGALEIGGRDFSMNYNLKIDMHDRALVVLRTFRSLFKVGSYPNSPVVEQIVGTGLVGYTVVEQDVRPPQPPASLPAPVGGQGRSRPIQVRS
jgi:hypothetical protein